MATSITQWDANGNPIPAAAATPPAPTQWDANGNPIQTPAPQSNAIPGYTKISGPPPAQDDPIKNLTANPGKQGLYRFMDTSTAPQEATDEEFNRWLEHAPVIYVPYGKALDLMGHPEHYQGLSSDEKANDWGRFIDHWQTQIDTATNPMQPVGAPFESRYVLHPDERRHLFDDLMHDPNLAEMRRGNFVRSLPPVQVGIGGAREAARTAVGLHDITPGLNKPAAGQPQSAIRKFAETPQQNAFQGLGGATEAMAEYASGEELLGAIGKVLGRAPTLAEAAKIEAEMQKGTTAGELFRQALKQGTVGGTQAYVKTGGDVGAALESAGIMAGGTMLAGGANRAITAARDAGAARAAAEAGAGAEAEAAAQAKYQAKLQKYQAGEEFEAAKTKAKDEHATRVDAINKANQALLDAHAERTAEVQRANQALLDAHQAELDRINAEYKAAKAARPGQIEQVKAQRAADIAAHEQQVTQIKQTNQAAAEAHAAKTEQAVAEAKRTATEAESARQLQGGRSYSEAARRSVEPHLRALEEAGQPTRLTIAQPGGGAGVPVERPSTTTINADESLGRIGDYTSARTKLQASLNQATQDIDAATNGRFSELKKQVADAQTLAHKSGTAEADAAYAAKRAEMDQFLSTTAGRVRPELLDAVRNGWRHYYVMGDLTTGLDRAVQGLPGESAVSGINGKTLTTELKRLVRREGRAPVEQVLGGPDRLKSLFSLGEEMSTAAGKKRIDEGVSNVAQYMESQAPTPQALPEAPTPAPFPAKAVKGAAPAKPTLAPLPEKPELAIRPKYQKPAKPRPAPPQPPSPATPGTKSKLTLGKVGTEAAMRIPALAGSKIGWSMAGPAGGFAGLAAGEAVARAIPVTLRKVQDALVTNPRVFKYLQYAVSHGVQRDVYAPIVAGMINSDNQPEEKTNGH